jgi:hypothetical protein
MLISFYSSFFNTPPLWSGELCGLKQFVFPEVDIDSLERGPIPSNLRLGHKIEYIFLQLIQHSKQYKVIAHNIPIRKGKESLGEIDFLLQDVVNKEFIHVELTYKFYVIPADSIQIERQLMGPNLRDSFHAKKERILQHQIPLLRSPEAITALQRFNIKASELLHRVCFKSQVFSPYGEPNLDLAPLNSNCISGRWISFQKFKTPLFYEYRYYLPSKPEWLLDPYPGVHWHTYNEIIDLISNKLKSKISPLLWIKSSDFTIEKLFIVWW